MRSIFRIFWTAEGTRSVLVLAGLKAGAVLLLALSVLVVRRQIKWDKPW